MLRITLCLLCGVYAMQQAESLPSAPWLLALAAIATGLFLITRLRLAAAFLFGCLLSAASGLAVIGDRLEPRLEGQVTEFTGTIDDFPGSAGEALRLIVRPQGRADLPQKIRLSWYEPTDTPQIGEAWLITARLRAPRGLTNPQGFDYEGWLFRLGIGATGYVVSAGKIAPQPDVSMITALRRHFVQRSHALLRDDAARAVLTAVTIGARQDITREQWDLYARTGTSHLMSISGLHIGLAAAGIFLLVRVLAAPFARGRNVRDAAVVTAAIGATAYTLISGLEVPAQRALLMVLLVAVTLLMRRPRSYARVLSVACLGILAVNPLAALTPGFQLSFFAVALLLWSGQQFRTAVVPCRSTAGRQVLNSVWQLTVLQVFLLFGLMPLTALLFDRITWLAPFVNLLAIPIFNLCTTPLSLLAIVLDGPMQFAGDALLRLAHFSVVILLWLVELTAKSPHAEFRTLPLTGVMLVALWATGLWAALPPGFPGRYLAWIATLSVILHVAPPPPRDCVDLHVLDVGQGLSVVAETHTRVAVFDTGPAFRSGSDTGDLVVVPFLRSLGRDRIDVLVVSHADLDHAGGVHSVFEQLDVGQVLFGELPPIESGRYPVQSRCAAGQGWHWDGIDFRMLRPPAMTTQSGNDTSCVLEINAGTHRALLTGDIEAPAERWLLAQNWLRQSYFVVVPHHGSRTSSTAHFVAALDADVAVVSAGYGNRWGFPKEDIARRWQAQGARLLSTATSGAISQRLCAYRNPQPLIEQRLAHRRYWHAVP